VNDEPHPKGTPGMCACVCVLGSVYICSKPPSWAQLTTSGWLDVFMLLTKITLEINFRHRKLLIIGRQNGTVSSLCVCVCVCVCARVGGWLYNYNIKLTSGHLIWLWGIPGNSYLSPAARLLLATASPYPSKLTMLTPSSSHLSQMVSLRRLNLTTVGFTVLTVCCLLCPVCGEVCWVQRSSTARQGEESGEDGGHVSFSGRLVTHF